MNNVLNKICDFYVEESRMHPLKKLIAQMSTIFLQKYIFHYFLHNLYQYAGTLIVINYE